MASKWTALFGFLSCTTLLCGNPWIAEMMQNSILSNRLTGSTVHFPSWGHMYCTATHSYRDGSCPWVVSRFEILLCYCNWLEIVCLTLWIAYMCSASAEHWFGTCCFPFMPIQIKLKWVEKYRNSQLSISNVQFCSSSGYRLRSIIQAAVVVILKRRGGKIHCQESVQTKEVTLKIQVVLSTADGILTSLCNCLIAALGPRPISMKTISYNQNINQYLGPGSSR